MEASPRLFQCKSCNQSSEGRYCSRCGQQLQTKRITFLGLLHDVFHLFTHMDRGILLTLKMLIVSPGLMQRQYIEGDRSRHQKPFAMFFISATVFALLLYWINVALINYYDAGDVKEALFFNKYMVMLLIGSIPFYTLLTYLFFISSRYNIAEIGVLVLYTVSMSILAIACINMLKFIWPRLETRYIEFPFIVIYNTITFMFFFDTSTRWIVILKSIACITIFYLTVASLQDVIVERLY